MCTYIFFNKKQYNLTKQKVQTSYIIIEELNCCVIHELLFFYIYYLILQSQFDALYSIEAAVNMCRCRTEKKETAI